MNRLYNLLFRLYCRVFFLKCGKNFKVGFSSNIKGVKNIIVGDDFFSGPFLYLNTNDISTITIGDDVMIGPYVKIISGNHILDYKYGPMNSSPRKIAGHDKGITIQNDVWIGASSIILDGSILSEGSVIGAGSLVSKYVPPYTITAGVPVKIIRARFSYEDLKILLSIKKSKYKIEDIIKIYKDYQVVP